MRKKTRSEPNWFNVARGYRSQGMSYQEISWRTGRGYKLVWRLFQPKEKKQLYRAKILFYMLKKNPKIIPPGFHIGVTRNPPHRFSISYKKNIVAVSVNTFPTLAETRKAARTTTHQMDPLLTKDLSYVVKNYYYSQRRFRGCPRVKKSVITDV